MRKSIGEHTVHFQGSLRGVKTGTRSRGRPSTACQDRDIVGALEATSPRAAVRSLRFPVPWNTLQVRPNERFWCFRPLDQAGDSGWRPIGRRADIRANGRDRRAVVSDAYSANAYTSSAMRHRARPHHRRESASHLRSGYDDFVLVCVPGSQAWLLVRFPFRYSRESGSVFDSWVSLLRFWPRNSPG